MDSDRTVRDGGGRGTCLAVLHRRGREVRLCAYGDGELVGVWGKYLATESRFN